MMIGATAWALSSSMRGAKENRLGHGPSPSIGTTRVSRNRTEHPGAGRSDRHELYETERRRRWIQPVGNQRARVFKSGHGQGAIRRENGARSSLAGGEALSPPHAQRERRHSSDPSSPAQFRADQARRSRHRRREERRRHGRRLSGSGSGFYGGQPRPHALPLPSAAAYG